MKPASDRLRRLKRLPTVYLKIHIARKYLSALLAPIVLGESSTMEQLQHVTAVNFSMHRGELIVGLPHKSPVFTLGNGGFNPTVAG